MKDLQLNAIIIVRPIEMGRTSERRPYRSHEETSQDRWSETLKRRVPLFNKEWAKQTLLNDDSDDGIAVAIVNVVVVGVVVVVVGVIAVTWLLLAA